MGPREDAAEHQYLLQSCRTEVFSQLSLRRTLALYTTSLLFLSSCFFVFFFSGVLDTMRATFVSIISSQVFVAAQYVVESSTTSGSDVFDGYVSFSIEFSSFPDFAGNHSHPNTYSGQLLANIADFSGSKPYIRVGGNTQDYALYNASLLYAINGTIDNKRSPDYPTTIFIGPSYFESYDTWEDVKFSHGLNLGLGGNRSEGWQSLLDTVPLACKALSGKLYMWQYGNEPDLFSTSAQGPVRPPGWNESSYVWQWKNGTKAIDSLVKKHCPELMGGTYGYLAPAFGGVGNRLKAPAAWEAGLNSEGNIKLFSTHNYISGAASPGVTLQGTLMNHNLTKRSVDAHVTEYNAIKARDPSVPPLIFGETNSLYNQGRPGLSNTFGAALWGVDFHLYSASVGLKRVHMHQGTNYRYAAWQPIPTPNATIGTKAPYYGSIFVAAALGNLLAHPARVIALTTTANPSPHEAVYATYVTNGTRLARIVILNMRGYNTTVSGHGLEPLPVIPARSSQRYVFKMGGYEDAHIPVRRLWANGSDAITGITYDGWSYNWELDGGRPVKLGNMTVGETVEVRDGEVEVEVPDSSAALLDFEGLY